MGYLGAEQLTTLAHLTAPLKRRIRELLAPGPGEWILDVGCGPGLDTVVLGHAVGPTGHIVGVDHDQRMIAAAEARAREAGVARWVRHEQADARALPFEAESFDACQSERVLQHLPDPGLALDEMIRVTRRDGRLVVADTDWASLSIDTDEVAAERRIARAVAEALPSGFSGRELLRLFRDRDLVDISVEAHPVVWTDYEAFRATSFPALIAAADLIEGGAVSEEDWYRLTRSLALAQARGAFFASGCLLLVSGVRAT